MARALRWLLVVPVVVAIAFTGCGSDKTVPGGGGGGRTFVGAAVCKGCHVETGQHWDGTAHAGALGTLTAIGQGSNAYCLPCHVVGYNQPSGFINATETPTLGGVQCENCHGAGSAHAANPTAESFSRAVTSASCGGCHTDAHHPTYDEWESSGHAGSTESSHGDKCLTCHSQEGFFYQLQAPVTPPTPEGEGRQFPQGVTNIGCATCHDPHEHTAHEAQLRLEKKQLCETCHRLSSVSALDPVAITSQPRHGASLIFEGTGAKTPNGTVGGAAMNGPNSAHKDVANDGCVTCHVFSVSKPSPNTDDPNVTGHSFRPNLLACTQAGCHTPSGRAAIEDGADQVAIALRDGAKAQAEAAIAQCRPYVTSGDPLYIDRNLLTGPSLNDYDVALWNYRLIVNNDPSKGVHNLDYTLAVLETARATFASLAPAPTR